MNKYSICVIGNGSAAFVSILSIINSALRNKVDVKITCLYDPNIPTIEVGESTSSIILTLLTNILGFRILKDLSKIDGTLKYGTKYKNWGENDFYTFHIDPALHVNSKKFSIWGMEELSKKFQSSFNVIHDNVIQTENTKDNRVIISGSRNNYIYDYVVDCRGFSGEDQINEQEYSKPSFTSVNSVILYPDYINVENPSIYTTSIAHDNGWMFEIPLSSRKTSGYLYNNNIINYETALNNFCEIKQIDKNIALKLRSFSWNEKYRNTAMDKNILYCGNKLFFFEPSQGFALHYYAVLNDIFISSLSKNKELISTEVNSFYLDAIEKIQDVVALTYLAKIEYNTKFWEIMKNNAINKLSNSKSFVNWCNNIEEHTHYSSHSNEILLNLINGMNIDLSIFNKVKK